MSLFGTSPEYTARASKAVKSSLFADDNANARTTTSSGLFADEGDEYGDDSPWGFQPTPKKQARGALVKTLLPATDVPESYVDTFDTLFANGDRAGNGISLARARQLLQGAGLGKQEQQRIFDIVVPQGSEGADGLGRGEFNVLLALIGLAQEGEELSLDSVDERRRRLPQPSLPELAHNTPETLSQQQRAPELQHDSPTPAKSQTQPNGQTHARPVSNQSFGYTDTDPWASPGNARINGLSNGASDPAPRRTTSAFTTAAAETSSTGNQSGPAAQSMSGSSTGEWTYDASTTGYSTSGLGGSTFGGSGADEDDGQESRAPFKPSHRGRVISQGAEEEVVVTSLPDKEGMFLFQYRNYEVTTARRNSRVVRRYSDFVWLLDCLHKKYPFRQLPLLPPKRVAINGNYIAADILFIEKRRRGLARFANALVRHPVLREEQLVTMFLTVPTELSVWRKQAAITVAEEFTGKELPPGLEDSLPSTLEDLFDSVRSGVRRSSEIYINLCTLLERLIKRKDGLAGEYSRFSTTLTSLTECSADTYKIDTNDVPLLNEGINSTAKHIATSQGLLIDEARAWDEGALEDFKRQRDALVSMRDLFDRRDRYARDSIPALEKRIASNENKLVAVRAKPERKAGEAEKLEDAIMKDKESIIAQHARGVFIKECVRDEIQFFQSTQYRISRMHQEWSSERVKFAELQSDCWRQLSEQVETMPLQGE